MPLRALLDVLFGQGPAKVGAAFPEMLDLASTTFTSVNESLWAGEVPEDLRKEVYEKDVRINQLQRAIRKDVFAHLVCGNPDDVTTCFVLLNVIKDAERLGDYVKNLVDPVIDLRAVPSGDLVSRIRQIGEQTERLLARVRPVFEHGEEVEAEQLLRKGREHAARCDALVAEIARAELPSGPTTALVLLTRFYKRLNAHATNILSAIVMPVHKIDYFDEEALELGGD